MTTVGATDVYYDPYDVDIHADPYPVFRRLREEAPLYYNDRYDFYAVSRFDDVEKGLVDHITFSSARGVILEMIRADIDFPPGVFICEDPPVHSAHRGVLSRVFTPKKMQALEPQVRALCAEVLGPLVGSGGFDVVADLGARVPMRVIGMLLGIPEQDQRAVQAHGRERTHREPGQPGDFSGNNLADPTFFGDYIEWRASHPSDDLMTDLLQVEFEDESGAVRRLTRQEVLTFVNVLASAGNDTTNRLIGWTAKVLADHPGQRRELVADRSLVPNAIEEVLRFEPPATQSCRTVTRDAQYHGETVPEGSVMMFLAGSANRDHRAFPPDGDVFDIHRTAGHHLSFGYGVHFCLGAALARLEGRVVLDELLARFPEWDVDTERARLDSSAIRGWATLPVVT
ncbi:MAG TPA: cytochrome P450 [Acidimicrobiales bacterium]|nr:cytochrome P450 [Acidimicrobiales bacterium]